MMAPPGGSRSDQDWTARAARDAQHGDAGPGGSFMTPGARSFDAVNDLIVPFLLVAMMWTFGNYALSVREALFPSANELLRFVFFFFLVGVVGIAKIRSVKGNDAVSLPYIAGLAFAVTVFIARFTVDMGGIAGSMSLPLSFLGNILTFAAVWGGVNWIARDCTVDPATEESAAASMFDPVPHDKRRPGRSVVVFSLLAALVFGLGQVILARANREAYTSGFAAALGYAASALTLLALTNLSGLRLYLASRLLRTPSGMVAYWAVFSLAIVAISLGIAWIAPKSGGYAGESIFARSSLPADASGPATSRGLVSGTRTRDDAWALRPAGDPGASTAGGTRATGGAASRDVGGEGSSGEGGRNPVEGSGGAQGAGQAEDQQGDPADAGANGEPRPGGDRSGDRGRRPDRPTRGTSGDPSAAPPMPEIGSIDEILEFLVLAAIVAICLVLLFMLFRWLARAARRGQFRVRLPSFRFPWSARRPAELVNPFANRALLSSLSPRDLVLRTYAGFMALAGICGCARKPCVTAGEFLQALPQPLLPLRDEAKDLSGLYVLAEYAAEADLEESVPRLREIWDRMDYFLEIRLNPQKV